MSASSFTQGRRIPGEKHSRWDGGGLKCGWELAQADTVLAGTLTRLEDQRANKYTRLSCVLCEGLEAERGNPASAEVRGSFTTGAEGDFTHHS